MWPDPIFVQGYYYFQYMFPPLILQMITLLHKIGLYCNALVVANAIIFLQRYHAYLQCALTKAKSTIHLK